MKKILLWWCRLGVIGIAVLLLAVSLWKTSQREWIGDGVSFKGVDYWFEGLGDNIQSYFLKEENKKEFWQECADKRLMNSLELAKEGEHTRAVRMLEKAEYYLLKSETHDSEQVERHLEISKEIKEMAPAEMRGIIDYWVEQVEVLQK